MATERARLDVELVGHDKVSPAAQSAAKSINELSLQTTALGSAITGFATRELVDFLGGLQSSFFAQERAMASVELGIARIGDRMGFTFDEAIKKAQDLQKVTIFGDEEILQKVTAQLLSFPVLVGDVFTQAQESALDIATLTGKDLQSIAEALGKALADPKSGIGALSRFGVTFNAQQKEIIQDHVEENRLLEARQEILGIIEGQYGGLAEYVADTEFGSYEKLKNDVGDLKEEFGNLVTEGLDPSKDRVEGLVGIIRDMDSETKAAAVDVTLFATSIVGLTAVIHYGSSLMKVFKGVINTTGGAFTLMAATIVIGGTLIMDQLGLVGDEFLTLEEKIMFFFARIGAAVLQFSLDFTSGILYTVAAAADSVQSLDDLVAGKGWQTTHRDAVGAQYTDAKKTLDDDISGAYGYFDEKSEERRKEQEELQKRQEELLAGIEDLEGGIELPVSDTPKTKGRNTERESALFAVLAELMYKLIGEVEESNELLRLLAEKMGVNRNEIAATQVYTDGVPVFN